MTAGSAGVDLPDLRVLGLDHLVLHEDADERRVAALVRAVGLAGVIKNPPVVAPLPGDRFVVLDGANRVSAMRQLGSRDVVVQVVDYDAVALSTWSHLVVDVDAAELLAAIRAVPGLEVRPSTLEAARRALGARESLAYLIEPAGAVHDLRGGDGLAGGAALLRQAVATYKGRAHIHRIQTDDMTALQGLYSDIAALVVFPALARADILALAAQHAHLPSGITRHVIPRRALRVNLDLDFLWSEATLAEKNRWLAEWTRHKRQASEIRFYEESTFLYDE